MLELIYDSWQSKKTKARSNMNEFGEANDDIPMLLEAQTHIWNHLYNFIRSMLLKLAVELGIPDIIHSHGKPISISELNSALSVHPTKTHFIPRLMRLLIKSGYFAHQKINPKDEEECYVLTKTGQLLLKDHPYSVTPLVQATLDPIISKSWQHATTWLHNEDSSPFVTAYGESFWDYAFHDSKLAGLFYQGMKCDSLLVTTALLNRGKEVFDGVSSLVDVGGGTGAATKLIAEAFPNIWCKVLDLPHVVAGLSGTTNMKFVAGNMFESIPPADAILLKWILHNWCDEECLKILRQCKKAVKVKLIVIDIVIKEDPNEDDETTETRLFFDMKMMVIFNGKERTEKEWEKLFFYAGFSGYKIIQNLGLRSVIEVYP